MIIGRPIYRIHAFADDVRQGVVAVLRELCVAVIKDVDERVVAADGRARRFDIPSGAYGADGVEVVAEIAGEVSDWRGVRIDIVAGVADEGDVGTDVAAEVASEGEVRTDVVADVANEGEVGTDIVAEVSDEGRVGTYVVAEVVDVDVDGNELGDVEDAVLTTRVVVSSSSTAVVGASAALEMLSRDEKASFCRIVRSSGLEENGDPEDHVLDITRADKRRGSKDAAGTPLRKRRRTRIG